MIYTHTHIYTFQEKKSINPGIMLTERPTCAMKLRRARTSTIIVREVSISRRDFVELRHDLNITCSRRLSRAHPGEERAVMHAFS